MNLTGGQQTNNYEDFLTKGGSRISPILRKKTQSPSPSIYPLESDPLNFDITPTMSPLAESQLNFWPQALTGENNNLT